jgi:tripartite-type tricarboxylate transporter receptor subunit TctC
VAARFVAQPLSERLKQPVIVVNLPGAGGSIGSKTVARAKPDGYTLMMGGTNLNVVPPLVNKSLDYNPVDDFMPIEAIGSDMMLFAINPTLPARTVNDFIQYTKTKAGKVVAGSAPGIAPHFAIELFKSRTKADITFVPYKGGGPAITDAMGGHIAMVVTTRSVLSPYVKAGSLRALAVTGLQRHADLPEVPTLRESGMQGVPPLIIWAGLMAPVRVPSAVVSKLKETIQRILKTPEGQSNLRRIGLDLPPDGTDFAAELKAQRHEFGQIAKEVRITID